MHDGTAAQGDQWLRTNLGAYADWATTHDSLLIVTWDEDDGSTGNHIAAIFDGARLLPGTDSTPSSHYTLLRTIEDSYHLPYLGASAAAIPLTAD